MDCKPLEAIADAVLFEGYILYPYRPSALKNQQRWNFGTLYPRAFADVQSPPERSGFRVDVLIEAAADTKISARVRFLQLVAPGEDGSEVAAAGGAWAKGFVRSRTLEDLSLPALLAGVEHELDLSGLAEDEGGAAPPAFRNVPRFARLTLKTVIVCDGVYRLTAAFANESPAPAVASFSRILVQDAAFTSAHMMLAIERGSFVSLLEPGPALEADAKGCAQDGVFPVLAGEAGDRSRMLCSPIILYDYPEIAPESAGNFFDGTEMDEMLALRVFTLTDEEKDEMRRSDPHARGLLERMETLPHEQLARVHGTVRGLRRITEHDLAAPLEEAVDLIHQPFDPYAERAIDPFGEHTPIESVRVFGMDVRPGDRVGLWPQKKADVLDMEMEGKVAIVEAIEQDLEGGLQFAVVLEDDPGRDLGMLRQTGHRFFFGTEEVEPLGLEVA